MLKYIYTKITIIIIFVCLWDQCSFHHTWKLLLVHGSNIILCIVMYVVRPEMKGFLICYVSKTVFELMFTQYSLLTLGLHLSRL